MTDEEKIIALKKLMKKTARQLKAIYADSGGYENPVNTDLVKTEKAMFYETARTILKKEDEE